MTEQFIKIRPNEYAGEEVTIDENTAKQLQLFSDEVERWHRDGSGRMWSGNIGKAIWLLVDREGFRFAESAFDHNDSIEMVAEMDGEAEEWRKHISEFEHIAMYSFLVYTEFDVNAAREILLEKFERVAEHFMGTGEYPFESRRTWHERNRSVTELTGIKHHPEDVADSEG